MRLSKEGAFDILMKILSRSRYTNAILRRWWILRGEKSREESARSAQARVKAAAAVSGVGFHALLTFVVPLQILNTG